MPDITVSEPIDEQEVELDNEEEATAVAAEPSTRVMMCDCAY